jgi:gluconate 5-dehydrogenase
VSFDLTGKVALVTGAAQGIGFGIAERLRQDGALVALADVNAEVLEKAAAGLGEPAEVATFTVDLAQPEQAHELPGQVVERFGRLDILVNNAGVRSVSSIQDHPLSSWHQALDINLTAPFLLIQAAVPHLLRTGRGRIVNITSVAAELGFKNRVAYNVSKAGLAMLTKSVALELAQQGIRCNAVAPGIIETPLNSDYFKDEAFVQVIRSNTPAAAWGRPRDIAAAVAFLSSDESEFVNGATILVDGGWSAGKGY